MVLEVAIAECGMEEPRIRFMVAAPLAISHAFTVCGEISGPDVTQGGALPESR